MDGTLTTGAGRAGEIDTARAGKSQALHTRKAGGKEATFCLKKKCFSKSKSTYSPVVTL